MGEYTENLNLIKPAQDEQYNVDDFNDNFDKIDDFAGIVPPRALTADKLTTGAKINGVNFKGDTDIITGLGLYSDTNTYNNTNLAYLYDSNDKLRIFQSIQNGNIGHNPLTNSVYWKEIQIGSKRHYGETVTSSLPILDDNTLHLADGSLLTQQDYPEFVSYVANLYNSLPSGDFSPAVQNATLGSNSWKGIAYGNNIFVAIGGSDYVSTSADGINWNTPTSLGLIGYELYSITFGNNMFVAVTYSGDRIYTSTDGINWNDTEQRIGSVNRCESIAYGNGKYVAITNDGVYYSENLSTWTKNNSISIPTSVHTNIVTFGENKFIIFDNNARKIFTSVDGITWNTYSNNYPFEVAFDVDGVTYDGIKYTAMNDFGLWTESTDGINWSPVVADTNLGENDWEGLAYGKNKIVAIGEDGYISVKEIKTLDVFISEEDWQTSYTTYGECGKYVYNSSANTVRIPLYNSYFTNTIDSKKLGNLIPASIPNIKASVRHLVLQDGSTDYDWDGAFYNAEIGGTSYRPTNTTSAGSNKDNIGLDASRSSSVYSDTATTVNTQSIKQLVYIVVRA